MTQQHLIYAGQNVLISFFCQRTGTHFCHSHINMLIRMHSGRHWPRGATWRLWPQRHPYRCNTCQNKEKRGVTVPPTCFKIAPSVSLNVTSNAIFNTSVWFLIKRRSRRLPLIVSVKIFSLLNVELKPFTLILLISIWLFFCLTSLNKDGWDPLKAWIAVYLCRFLSNCGYSYDTERSRFCGFLCQILLME